MAFRAMGPRWALKKLDREALMEAAIVQAWASAPGRLRCGDEIHKKIKNKDYYELI